MLLVIYCRIEGSPKTWCLETPFMVTQCQWVRNLANIKRAPLLLSVSPAEIQASAGTQPEADPLPGSPPWRSAGTLRASGPRTTTRSLPCGLLGPSGCANREGNRGPSKTEGAAFCSLIEVG